MSVVEGDSGRQDAVFTVTLLFGSSHAASVDYATADGTATLADGDYRSRSGTLKFQPGVTSRTIRVPIAGDLAAEPDETFAVNLSNERGGNPRCGVSIQDPQGVGTIVNDDTSRFLIDDFADGDDAGWTRIDFTGAATFDASSSAYRLRTAGSLPPDDPSVGTMAATWDGSASDVAFGNGIVGGTVRANTPGTTAGFYLRGNTDPGSDHDYGFYGSSSFGTFYIERFDITAGGQTILAMADPAEHPFVAGVDYHIEGGVRGDRIWLRAWAVGEPRPARPLLVVRDDTFGPADGTLLGAIAFFDPAAVTGPVQVDATFDDITFRPRSGRPGGLAGTVAGESFRSGEDDIGPGWVPGPAPARSDRAHLRTADARSQDRVKPAPAAEPGRRADEVTRIDLWGVSPDADLILPEE
jgi:hypothetical protein